VRQHRQLIESPAFRSVMLPSLLTVATLRSLVGTGYLVQVDDAFGPKAAPLDWSFYTPVQLAVNSLQLLVGGETAGRIYVIAALFLCGFSAMLLLRERPWWAQCTGGLLAMLNPFVYDRLVEGQWGVVVATAGLLLFMASWIRLRRRPDRLSALLVAACTLLVVAFSPNFAAILVVLVAGLAVFESKWRDPSFRRWALAGCAGGFALSLYGIAGFFISRGSSTYAGILQFTTADFSVFQATAAPGYGVIPALIGLYGEWSERLGRYLVADAAYSWWILPSGILAALAVIGAWLDRRRAWILAVGAIGVAVSASTATALGQQVLAGAASHFPLLAVYREPQKWDALWLVALVVLIPSAVEHAVRGLERLGSRASRAAGPAVATLVAAAVMAPAGWVELRDSANVISPVAYPASWYQAASYLAATVPSGQRIAVLPWHLYEFLPFTGRLTVDPATVFFPGALVASTDPELAGRPPTDPIGAASSQGSGCALATSLRQQAVSRALVLKDAPGGLAALSELQSCGLRVALNVDDEVAILG
jgi:hypothetical protein